MRRRSGPQVLTPCVVLRVSDLGDADRIVTLLTAAFGKISAVARGARSSRRRFGAALVPFGYGEALLQERPGQELWVLSELDMSQGFANLPLELARFGYASYACELCLHLCPLQVPETTVLRLLLALLEVLDRLPIAQKPTPLLLRVFELQVLQAVGLGLQLTDCAACGQQVPPLPLLPLDVERGGVLCQGCYSGPIPAGLGPRGGGLSQALRTTLSALAKICLIDGHPEMFAVDGSMQQTIKQLLRSVIEHHIGTRLRTIEFIEKVNLFERERGCLG